MLAKITIRIHQASTSFLFSQLYWSLKFISGVQHKFINGIQYTEVLIVKTPALVAVASWSTLLQSILPIHVILLAQIFIFQHLICTVDTQKFLVCFWIILHIQQQLIMMIIIMNHKFIIWITVVIIIINPNCIHHHNLCHHCATVSHQG